MIFSPTVCHRHTSTLCVAGRGDSVDGLATGWTVGFEPRVGGRRFFLSHACLDQLWGPPNLFYRGKWPTLLGAQHSGHGAVHSSQCGADIKNQ